MDFLIEFILEFILEKGVESSQSKRVPKLIRYFLILFLAIFFIAVIGIIYFAAFAALKIGSNILAFILFFTLATFMLLASIIKFRNAYINKKVDK